MADITTKIDSLEDRIDRLNHRLEELNLTEVMVKGQKILELYDFLKTYGVVDTLFFLEEINDLKKRLTKIELDPLNWLMRDKRFQDSLRNHINKTILREIKNIGLLHLYQDDPKTLIRTVKDAVKEYLEIWEVNDQVAQQLVEKVIMDKMLGNVANTTIEFVKESIIKDLEERRKKLDKIKEVVEDVQI